MPLNNIPLFSPAAPGAVNIKSFQDLRTYLLDYVTNTWMQYVNNYFQQEMLPVLNTFQFNYGPNLASASSLNPTALIQTITGSVAIDTINPPPTPPASTFAGPLCLFAQDGYTTTTSGNILLAVSVPTNHMALFVFNPILNKWGVITS